MTKEAKLTAAMRIVEEWNDYDSEIKRLQLQLGETEDHEEETVSQPQGIKSMNIRNKYFFFFLTSISIDNIMCHM